MTTAAAPRALVTGANGFVAQWALRAICERGWTVVAGSHDEPSSAGVLSASQHASIEWVTLDVTDAAETRTVVRHARPDVVLHLAAVSHVPAAAKDPRAAWSVNVLGTVTLLDAIRTVRDDGACDPVVLVVGSAEEYGRHDPSDMPLDEVADLRPLTVYAATKVAQEIAALQAARAHGLRVVCARSFNHSGAGQPSHFVLPGLVQRALALPRSGGTLALGNGDVVRDFLHVTDVVDAYLSLLERGEAGEVYNVCSGEGITVRDLAEAVLVRAGVTAGIAAETSLTRPVDVPVLVGSNRKLRRATGWAPARTRDDIIDDLIHAASR